MNKSGYFRISNRSCSCNRYRWSSFRDNQVEIDFEYAKVPIKTGGERERGFRTVVGREQRKTVCSILSTDFS